MYFAIEWTDKKMVNIKLNGVIAAIRKRKSKRNDQRETSIYYFWLFTFERKKKNETKIHYSKRQNITLKYCRY